MIIGSRPSRVAVLAVRENLGTPTKLVAIGERECRSPEEEQLWGRACVCVGAHELEMS